MDPTPKTVRQVGTLPRKQDERAGEVAQWLRSCSCPEPEFGRQPVPGGAQ